MCRGCGWREQPEARAVIAPTSVIQLSLGCRFRPTPDPCSTMRFADSQHPIAKLKLRYGALPRHDSLSDGKITTQGSKMEVTISGISANALHALTARKMLRSPPESVLMGQEIEDKR